MVLLEKLSEGKVGNVDVKLITNMMLKKNIKTATFLADSGEAKKFFDFYEFLFKKNPVSISYLSNEMRLLLFRAK